MRVAGSLVVFAAANSILMNGSAQTQTSELNTQTETASLSFMATDDLRLEAISVFGDRTPGSPGSFSAIDGQTIEEISADHPAEVLNTLPGVNIHMNSGQEHLISIRSPVLTGGAGQGSFLILQNGVPTRSPAFGNVNMLFEIHHEVADVIEVVRGPGSAKYGSNAVHGLINIIFPDGDARSSSLRASVSSLGRYKGDAIARKEDGFAALSVQHDNGWRDVTGIDQFKATVSHDFMLGGWNGTAWGSFMNLNQESAGFIEGPEAYKDEDIATSNPNPEAFRDARFAMAAVRLERAIGDVNVEVTPFVRWQDMTFRQHFLPYKGLEENSHEAIGAQGRVSGEAGGGVWRLGGMVDLASGDLVETQAEPFGFFPGDSRFPVGRHYDYTVDTTALALWGEYEFEIIEDVKLLAGLRGETHDYDYTTHTPSGISGRFNVPSDRSDSFELLTPKLGAIWTEAIGNVDLYANYARGERAPQASDLYRLQSQQIAGEAKEETLDSLEIGARGSVLDDRLMFDIAAYTMEKENFFFRDADGLNVTDGKTRHKGIEASFVALISDTVSVSGNISRADHTYAFDNPSSGIASGNKVDTAPDWLGDLAIDWQVTPQLLTSLSVDHTGNYFTDGANAHEYGGHTIASARAAYQLSESFELWLSARNLFDERYADRADFAFGNERYFPGEPLNVTFGIRSNW